MFFYVLLCYHFYVITFMSSLLCYDFLKNQSDTHCHCLDICTAHHIISHHSIIQHNHSIVQYYIAQYITSYHIILYHIILYHSVSYPIIAQHSTVRYSLSLTVSYVANLIISVFKLQNILRCLFKECSSIVIRCSIHDLVLCIDNDSDCRFFFVDNNFPASLFYDHIFVLSSSLSTLCSPLPLFLIPPPPPPPPSPLIFEPNRQDYFGLAPGKTVGLKYAYVIMCNNFDVDVTTGQNNEDRDASKIT